MIFLNSVKGKTHVQFHKKNMLALVTAGLVTNLIQNIALQEETQSLTRRMTKGCSLLRPIMTTTTTSAA